MPAFPQVSYKPGAHEARCEWRFEPNLMSRASWKCLFDLSPAPWRWRSGVEASMAMALALGAWTAAGRQSLGLLASLGAFTALYCAGRSQSARALALPFVALGFVLASAVGVASSPDVILGIVGLVLVTAAASILTFGFALGPPGPLMFVLVAGVSGRVSAQLGTSSVFVRPYMIPLLVASGAALSYLLIVAQFVFLPTRRGAEAQPGLRPLLARLKLDQQTKIIAARMGVAVILSGLLGAQLGVQRIYWVTAAAIAVLQEGHTWHITAARVMHRIFGTVVGLGLFAVVCLFEPTGFALVALIAMLQFAIEVVVARNYALALVFITPSALIIATAAHASDPRPILEARLLDTVLGATVALAVFWVGKWLPPLRAMRL